MKAYIGRRATAAILVLTAGWSLCAFGQFPMFNMGGNRQSSSSSSDQQEAGLKGDALVQYDAETGSLIVVTDEETNQEISKVIEELDRPIPQVLIKVLFLEVTHSNDLDLGVEGFLTKTETYNFSDRVDTETIESLFGLADEATGGFYRVIENDLDITLRALAQVAKLEVLSRPSILTRNNEEAVITVGQEVPFIRNSRVTDEGQVINTVEYEDIGIILTVTPHINDNRIVSMEVEPEISTTTGESVPISNGATAPVFAKRSAETGVVVPDGCTVVIGGLMEDSTTETTKKIPLLGDIPLLGAAFRRKIDEKSKTELLIFLTPHVVEGVSELEDMTVSERADTRLAPKAFKEETVNRFIGNRQKAEPESAEADAPPLVPDEPANRGAVRRKR